MSWENWLFSSSPGIGKVDKIIFKQSTIPIGTQVVSVVSFGNDTGKFKNPPYSLCFALVTESVSLLRRKGCWYFLVSLEEFG